MEFRDVVVTRKSVRSYSDKRVEAEKLTQILDSARLAPSWANKQCWSYVVVKDKAKIEKLTIGIGNSWLKQAKVVVVACGDPKKSGSHNGMDYYLVDVAISMGHLVLAATDLGLGTCWIGAFDEIEVKKILGIPTNLKVIALTPLGYASNGVRNKLLTKLIGSKKRQSLETMVHCEKW